MSKYKDKNPETDVMPAADLAVNLYHHMHGEGVFQATGVSITYYEDAIRQYRLSFIEKME